MSIRDKLARATYRSSVAPSPQYARLRGCIQAQATNDSKEKLMSDDIIQPLGGSEPPGDDPSSNRETPGTPDPNAGQQPPPPSADGFTSAPDYSAGGTPPPPPPPPPPGGFTGMPDPNAYDYPLKPKRDDPHYTQRNFTWQEIWQRAVTEPTVETYTEHLHDPQMSMSRGLTWVFFASIIGAVVQAVVTSMFNFNTFGDSLMAGSNIGATLCCAPIFAAIGIVGFLIVNAIQYVVASLMGGEGSFEEQVYLMASYSAPVSLISSIVGVIPCLGGLVSLGLAVYALYLNVISLQAAHRFGAGKAIMAALGWIIIFCVGCACLMIMFLVLLGPAIGNVFSDIINELVTPTPSSLLSLVRVYLGI